MSARTSPRGRGNGPIPALLLLGFLIAGCHRSASPAAAAQPPPVDPWKLICVDPHTKTPALLWNGLIGFRFGRDGTGIGQPMFDIDKYDFTGEEKIKTLVSPVLPEGQGRGDGGRGSDLGFDADEVTDYSQTLDMKTGLLDTKWKLNGKQTEVQAVLDPMSKTVAWRMGTPDATGTGMVKQFDEVKARAALAKAAHIANKPLPPIPTYEDFDAVAKASADYWAKAWQTDIEIDGPVEDQQAVRSFMFYLRSAIHPKGLMAISPFGLSNAKYNGHVFWDADIWVFPALALVDPERAKVIPEYRIARFDRARGNFNTWLQAGVPDAGGHTRKVLSHRPLAGAKFPWESSVSGKETATGNSQYEDHISGSVAWGMGQAGALDLVDNHFVMKVNEEVGSFYYARSVPNSNGKYEISSTMSPDENHIGDNDLYTNLLAQWLTGENFKLPRDSASLLTYDHDPLRSYKQAAAVLSIYPLQYPEAEKEAKVMMDRFADKVSKNGPAMSDSLHALIWARIGEPDKGYEVWRKSWQDFTNHPLLLFSEKRSTPETYFTTGAAGCLQSVLYGFLGFRIDSKQDPQAPWSIKLRDGHYLSVKPHLPTAWKSVKFKNFHVLGKSYTLTATHQGVKVTPGDS